MINTKKTVLALVLLFAVTAFVVAPTAQAADVGYINMQEVVQTHASVAEAQQNLEEEAGQLQQEFQGQIEGLDQEEDQEEIQQIQQQFQQQIQELQMAEEQALENEVLPDIERAQEALGYDIIVSQEAVVSGGEDITDQVINYFEEADDIETAEQDQIQQDQGAF